MKKIFLNAIEVQNFKCFNSKELQFSTGITHIDGRNGSGKSSILEAISYVFGNGGLGTTDIKDPKYSTILSAKVDGKDYDHITSPRTDRSGKITGTTGSRRVNGLDSGVKDFQSAATWPTNSSYLWDLDAARQKDNAQNASFQLAGVKPFSEWIESKTISPEVFNAFSDAKGDVDDTLKILKIKSASGKKDAERFKAQAEALEGQIKQVPAKAVLSAAMRENKELLLNERFELTAQLSGAKKSDEAIKEEINRKAAEAKKLINDANAKRSDAMRLISEARFADQARVDEANKHIKAQADAENAKRFKLEQAYNERVSALRKAKDEIAGLEVERESLITKKQRLRDRWVSLTNVDGYCPYTNAPCATAKAAMAERNQSEIAKVIADGKEVAAQIAEVETRLSSAKANIPVIEEDVHFAKIAFESFQISVPKYEVAQPINPEEVDGYIELMAEADALSAKAQAIEVPSFNPSAETSEISAKLAEIYAALNEIEETEKEVAKANAEVEATIRFNNDTQNAIDAADRSRVKAEEIAAIYAGFVEDFTKLVADYMKEASDLVNGLFVGCDAYLPGLRIKLFAENMTSQMGRSCFVPQIVRPDGSVSEALSDGETQLFAIALIRNVYQPVAGVTMPILVDRAEAIDSDRLEAALGDNQAIVATRKDCDLAIS